MNVALFRFSFVIERKRLFFSPLASPDFVRHPESRPVHHPMPPFSAARPGLSVLSRLLAAVLGGYLLASALAVFLAAALPAPRTEAVLAGVQWSFALHVLAVIWAFSPISPGRAWLGLLVPAAALAAVAALLARSGG